MNDVVILGAGAWGTALALQAHRAGARTTLVLRTPFEGRNNPRLPAHPLPGAITLTPVCPPEAALVVVAIPMQSLRAALLSNIPRGPLLLCVKGLETGTGLLPLELAALLHPARPAAILTGPNFAHEIAAGLPAAAVLAGDAPLRAQAAERLGSAAFRLYGNEDPVGAQLGGAAKNVIAIAAGAVMGAGLGENARAALITRSLAELSRLVVAEGGRAETVAGLSGLGDLLLTCTGAASRNYRLGLALGRGQPLPEALAASAGVVEGVTTAPALLARAGAVDMPVCAAVAGLLAGHTTLGQAMAALLSRPTRDE